MAGFNCIYEKDVVCENVFGYFFQKMYGDEVLSLLSSLL